MYYSAPSTGGLLWGLKVPEGNENAQRIAIANGVAGHRFVSWTEGHFVSCPRIVEFAGEIEPGLIQAGHINCWSVWKKKSAYWPMQAAIADVADMYGGWLRDKADQFIEFNWGGSINRLIDIRIPMISNTMVQLAQFMKSKYHVNLIIADEAHSDEYLCSISGRPFHPPYPSWSFAQGGILRRIGGVIPNGTIGHLGVHRGRFWQNCQSIRPDVLLRICLNNCDELPQSGRSIILEFSSTLPHKQKRFLTALACLVDGIAQSTIGRFEGIERGIIPPLGIPIEYLKGTSATPVLSQNESYISRVFQMGTLRVNLETQEVAVIWTSSKNTK